MNPARQALSILTGVTIKGLQKGSILSLVHSNERYWGTDLEDFSMQGMCATMVQLWYQWNWSFSRQFWRFLNVVCKRDIFHATTITTHHLTGYKILRTQLLVIQKHKTTETDCYKTHLRVKSLCHFIWHQTSSYFQNTHSYRDKLGFLTHPRLLVNSHCVSLSSGFCSILQQNTSSYNSKIALQEITHEKPSPPSFMILEQDFLLFTSVILLSMPCGRADVKRGSKKLWYMKYKQNEDCHRNVI